MKREFNAIEDLTQFAEYLSDRLLYKGFAIEALEIDNYKQVYTIPITEYLYDYRIVLKSLRKRKILPRDNKDISAAIDFINKTLR